MTLDQENEHDKLEDFRVLTKTLDSFITYESKTIAGVLNVRRRNLHDMQENPLLRKYIEKYNFSDHLYDLEQRVHANQQFLDHLLQVGKMNWVDSREESHQNIPWSTGNAADYSKVQSTLKQLVREWSDEGEKERAASYGLILQELEQLYPTLEERHQIKVLVPGCGLARLPFELASRGFQAQGNEFSYHMLITSNFMLNHTSGLSRSFNIYPYINSFSNHNSWQEQLQGIAIPDVDPEILLNDMKNDITIPENGLLSMSAGSFDEIYGKNSEDKFDVITTVFFIDTSPHLPKTIKIIADTLKSGGYWINFGPLLWHYENDEELCGFELPMDTILQDLIPSMQLEIIKHSTNNQCRYTSPPFPKTAYVYNCDFWIARKL